MRTRLPVKLKVAVLSAALTFVILCVFAVVVGTVAEQRIVAGFDDDLRATVGELQDKITLELTPGGVQLNDSDRSLLAAAAAGDPIVRVVNSSNKVVWPEHRPQRALARATDHGRHRCGHAAGDLARARRAHADTLGGLRRDARNRHHAGRLRPVRQARAVDHHDGEPRAPVPGLRRPRRHAARLPRRHARRSARDAPDRGPDPRRARGRRTRDPDITLPKPQANDEVADLAHTFEDMLRELSAAREETEATLARQRKFVADASHELRTPLTQHPGEPRAARGRAGRRAARHGRLGAPLVASDAAARRRPPAAGARRRRARGAERHRGPGRHRGEAGARGGRAVVATTRSRSTYPSP